MSLTSYRAAPPRVNCGLRFGLLVLVCPAFLAAGRPLGLKRKSGPCGPLLICVCDEVVPFLAGLAATYSPRS